MYPSAPRSPRLRRFGWFLGLGSILATFAACGATPSSPLPPPAPSPPSVAEVAPPTAEPSTEKREEGKGGDSSATPSPSAPVRSTPLPPETGLRIAAIGPHVSIWPQPSFEGVALGTIRFGTSVTRKRDESVPGKNCAKGWHEVLPRGFVCLNHRTTLDMADPYYLALRDVAPRKGALYPYRYAYSRGAPMYSRVPSPEQWREVEARYGAPGTYADLGPWAEGHEELIDEEARIEATDPVPWYFEGGMRHVHAGHQSPKVLVYKHIPNGSMLSYGRAFEMHGRVWLVSSDLTLVPADRVQVIQESAFEGVDLMARGLELPLGWNRTKKPQSIYRRNENGAFVASGETLAAKQWVAVVDRRVGSPEDAYFELRERPGFFLRAATTTLSRKRKQPPRAIKPGEKWIDAHINPGTLTAYVGDRPVYATLFSPGKGGVPVPGLDHTKYATTQTGYFRYEWKERVATMSNEKGDPRVLWFSDVPRIQYIRAPLAMHVAYWHADFANPKSAECVNISARDGKFLFEWTDPKVPEEWGAVRPGGGFGKSTPIMINGVWVD